MHWRLKALLQKGLSRIPGGETAHYALQRRFGGLRDFSGEFDSKIEDWSLMMGYLQRVGSSIRGARLLEVGTGWYPTFPWCCYLGGAASIVTIDLVPLLKEDLVRQSVDLLERHLPLIADRTGVPLEQVASKHARLRKAVAGSIDLDIVTEGVIRYHAPADARQSGLPDGSIDLVLSNSVLEHVPQQVVVELFREARRILTPTGLMVHGVNCGDHYAYVDRAVTQLNYLRYSDADWQFWNSEFLYQNRLRAHAFTDMARAAGFEILLDTANPSERRLKELSTVPVHPQFSGFTPEQLCVTSIDFVARKR